jgi:hypothetical protein
LFILKEVKGGGNGDCDGEDCEDGEDGEDCDGNGDGQRHLRDIFQYVISARISFLQPYNKNGLGIEHTRLKVWRRPPSTGGRAVPTTIPFFEDIMPFESMMIPLSDMALDQS